MIQVRVAQQSAVSVRIAGAASVRVDVTGTTVVGAPEYSGPYDITPLFSAQVLPSLTKANVTSALGYTPPTTDTKYTLPTGNASTAGGVKLSDSTSSISSTSGGIAATPAAVFAAIAEAKLAAWPIGSIYMSVNSTSPANLFGGTWEMISDTFLFAASSSHPAGSTGGEFAHKLTQSELPDYSLSVANGSNVIRSKTGSSADAYVQTQSSGWGIPNWESKTVTVASGGSGAAHNNMPPYLSVWIWKRTK